MVHQIHHMIEQPRRRFPSIKVKNPCNSVHFNRPYVACETNKAEKYRLFRIYISTQKLHIYVLLFTSYEPLKLVLYKL